MFDILHSVGCSLESTVRGAAERVADGIPELLPNGAPTAEEVADVVFRFVRVAADITLLIARSRNS